ncbi:hypothetical protein GOP47_0009019 [Adiantum capillus-veneris]|uniref:leucine--tRNA ligase n=2 Tax=Adiantum capillus-veneris TaxID=13818 RepID=A0A9D4UZP8_ADICA|nr:hypothetical protein GOP47_0009019 [Adiantum capillus-veneris]
MVTIPARHLEANIWSPSSSSLCSCFFNALKGKHGQLHSLCTRARFVALPATVTTQKRRHLRKSAAEQGVRYLCASSSSSVATTGVQLEQEGAQSPRQPPRAYPFHEIEPKWQHFWEANHTFRTQDVIDTSKPKFYVLDMFPYPSGAGLHVGHPEGYTATDIVARYKRMRGFNVLHPMGWDAFGLPAEQYAIETGTHPRITTKCNISRFRKQLKSLGFSYDWQREISTTEPEYYKWTQWIFIQLFNKGLAYQAEVPVNWCPALGTVLANEEVIDGLSERGGHPVIRKPMRQWMLKITEYADRLLKDLDELDWPESIKDMQRNWIGKSEGAEIDFAVKTATNVQSPIILKVYTTRPDTICGATYLVIAPEHPLLKSLVSPSQTDEVRFYVEAAARKSDLERTELQKDKSGVFSGAYALNPATKEAIPIWVADYVLGSYGTGAIMAVPAHDTRDFEFAQKFDLPVRVVISLEGGESCKENEAYTGQGLVKNSCFEESGIDLNGLPSDKAASKVVRWLQKKGCGKQKINYKLRDWLFARQRYWGEPFPVVFLNDSGEAKTVNESDLPIKLPEIDDFSPTGTGEPPLAKALDWVKTVDTNSGKSATRETNTMPQWAGSCWYYLRFMDPSNQHCLVDPVKERYWGPVDLYVGGAEHSVLHLLYARFWHKVLFDIGVVSTKEPFQCLVNQGMILGEVEYTAYKDSVGRFVSVEQLEEGSNLTSHRIQECEVQKIGETYVLKDNPSIRVCARAHKMSKSRGNVINPDDVVNEYGADSLRLYEMFMGPLRDTKIWSTNGVEGVYRFLARAWRLVVGQPSIQGTFAEGSVVTDDDPTREQLRALHQCIEKVTEEIEGMRFNTAIAAMMEFINIANKWTNRPRAILESFVLLLSPLAPHLAEELWQRMGHPQTLAYEPWPKAIDDYLIEAEITVAVQVNGKTRGTIQIPAGADEGAVVTAALKNQALRRHIGDKKIVKKIFVPGKILNLIIPK